MKVLLISDAWIPQVNGVVTTLFNSARYLQQFGCQVDVIQPGLFRTLPCPTYPEIRLSLAGRGRVGRMIERIRPDIIHIATEGPLGIAARNWCVANDIPFATSYHTRFPEYLHARIPIPLAWTYRYLNWFHGPGEHTLVRSETQRKELAERGFEHLKLWPGAVDTEIFYPRGREALALHRPISMYMGRVAVEKGLDEYLSLELPGSRVIVGDGPDRSRLEKAYPEAVFLGAKFGDELARCLSAADVFVFPSRTDTLGLVMLEAMACGVPVAAFPVPGPSDIITQGSTGVMHDDLAKAVFGALKLDGEACVEYALSQNWYRATERLLAAQTITGLGASGGSHLRQSSTVCSKRIMAANSSSADFIA